MIAKFLRFQIRAGFMTEFRIPDHLHHIILLPFRQGKRSASRRMAREVRSVMPDGLAGDHGAVGKGEKIVESRIRRLQMDLEMVIVQNRKAFARHIIG